MILAWFGQKITIYRKTRFSHLYLFYSTVNWNYHKGYHSYLILHSDRSGTTLSQWYHQKGIWLVGSSEVRWCVLVRRELWLDRLVIINWSLNIFFVRPRQVSTFCYWQNSLIFPEFSTFFQIHLNNKHVFLIASTYYYVCVLTKRTYSQAKHD